MLTEQCLSNILENLHYIRAVKKHRLNFIIILGLVGIVGILVAQLLWTRQAFDLEQQKFSQKAHIALLEVVKMLYEGTTHELPSKNPIEKISNDYYIVNVENDFEPEILEHYLTTEFAKANIDTDFEYAMYNCQSDEMVYGNYVSVAENASKKTTVYFPKHENLVYYFAVRFPNENSFLFSSLKFWVGLSVALLIILLIYVYSIVTIIQQKKYSDLQRDFINNMTHEFKTPLSSILIASNYLMKQPGITSDDKLEKYTGIIISQSNKLNAHIEKILNTAKSDNDAMTPDLKEISIVKLIQDVLDNIKLKHNDLNVSIITDKNYVITADEFHLTNLIYNLVDNSVKYCETKPAVTIDISQTGDNLQLGFSDNGIGVPQKELNHIFDKFHRIPNSRSSEVTGFGLGLYYVKKVCRMHNWKISAKNNESGGLKISIKIPNKV